MRYLLTVPRSKRYRPAAPGVKVHTTTREMLPSDVVVRQGIRVTAPVRAILDAAEAGTAPEQVIAATVPSIKKGLATRSQELAAPAERSRRVEQLVRRALQGGPPS